jgi:dTDP-4-dehydrorhamnose reductase
VKKVDGYANAVFSGFPTIVLADIISTLITEHPKLSGVYHVSSDPINKFDLLNLINKSYNLGMEIERFDDFHIDRSLDSTKFRSAAGFTPEPWETMIEVMANDETPYEDWRRNAEATA